ncbi:hypothetical protein ACIA5C_28450 [Actinoplanes sp. NPDC051343]|uniref:hypothetical protein n=1 Tax=Actinoplanes sp. NPDC051343 TaxID=3363906 RepID=UPI003798173D
MGTLPKRTLHIVADCALFAAFAGVLLSANRGVKQIALPVIAVGFVGLYIVQAREAKRRRPVE